MRSTAGRQGRSDEFYWAALQDEELIGAMQERCEQFSHHLERSGLFSLWRRMAETYYRGVTRSYLEAVGEQNEFTQVPVGHVRNILSHLHQMTISARPMFEPEATNTDYLSRMQIQAARGLLDYYFADKGFELHISRWTEMALVYGEAFAVQTWDGSLGDMLDVETSYLPGAGPEDAPQPIQRPIYQGDVRVELFTPESVIRDVTSDSFARCQWLIVRQTRNRWDLIAQFPQHREAILSAPLKTDRDRRTDRLGPARLDAMHGFDTDEVDVYTLYHDRSPAVPLGRVVTTIGDETVLSDNTMDELGYLHMPVYRMSAGDIDGSPFGYGVGFDLLALADLADLLHSTVATNQLAFGVQSVLVPAGSGIKPATITNGLRLIEYTQINGKIEPLQLTATPAEVFNYLGQVEKLMETLSGVNSVTRGQPEKQLRSAAAIAIVQSQAVEFTRTMQMAYGEGVRRIGTGLIELFKKHANSPRLAAIAGSSGRTHLKAMQGDDISGINRVTVSLGSHLSRTVAGRLSVAEAFVKNGFVKSPDQYVEVLMTGRLEPLTSAPETLRDLIQSENEALSRGEQVEALLTDDHAAHIRDHAPVMADVEARKNPAAVEAYTAHVAKHLELLQTMPPVLAAALGQPQVQMPGAGTPPGGEPPPGATPVGGPPPPGGSQIAPPGPENTTGMPGAPAMPGSAQNPMPDATGL